MQFKIQGEPMPVVVCEVNAGETMITEKGSMVWMSDNMKMETNTGGGGLKGMFGKVMSGESLFQNNYTAQGGPGLIAFASSFVGSIRAVEVGPGRSVIVQKGAMLASTQGVTTSIHFQKKLGAGFFGGEGFIMQKLSGQGTAFLEIDGYAVEYDLAPGQTMLIDTGNLAMMDESCTMDIETVKGVKNMLLGGEIILQTMTIPTFANTLIPYMPKDK